MRLQVSGDPAEIAAFRELIAAFERKVSDVRVELVPIGKQKDHMAKLTTAFSGGTPPDLFLVNYRRFGQFAEKDVLEPLGPRLERSATLKGDQFYEPALEGFRLKDTLVCLPVNISSLVVYYNRALFERFGVPLPKPGWTWDDFLAAARGLTRDTDGDKKTDIYGLGFEPTLSRISPFVWQAGGDVVDNVQRPTRFTLREGGALDAARYLLALPRTHQVVPPLADARSEDFDSRFAHGRLGMLLQSRRAVPTFRTVKDLDWDVAPLPASRQQATVLHSDGYCMARSSPVKDAAFRFVEYALGPEGATLLARSGRTVPSVKAVAEGPAFLDPGQRPASAKVFLDSIPHLRRLPNIGAWNEIETRADPVVEEWFYAPPGSTYALSPASGGGMAGAASRRGEPASMLGKEVAEATRGMFPTSTGP